MTAPTRTRRLFAGTALALLLAGSTAACSGSGSDADDKTTTTAARTTTTEGTDDGPTTTTDDGPTTTEGTDDGPTTTGDDEPSGDADRQDYVDALKASFDTGDAEMAEIYEAGQVECLAESYVDIIGVDALVEAGITPDELAESEGDGPLPKELGIGEDEANELYDQFEACDIDLVDTFKRVFAQIGGKELTPTQSSCLDDAITEENLRDSFVADFSGTPLEPDPLDAAGECLGF